MLKTLFLGILLLVALPLGLIALVFLPLLLIGGLVKLLIALIVLPFRLLGGFAGCRPICRRGSGLRADSAGPAGSRGLGRGQVPDSGRGARRVAGLLIFPA